MLGARTVVLTSGSVFTVPRGTYHKPSAPRRAEVLLFEPTRTLTVGDRQEDVPAHVDVRAQGRGQRFDPEKRLRIVWVGASHEE